MRPGIPFNQGGEVDMECNQEQPHFKERQSVWNGIPGRAGFE